jgi:hypothetical protein
MTMSATDDLDCLECFHFQVSPVVMIRHDSGGNRRIAPTGTSGSKLGETLLRVMQTCLLIKRAEAHASLQGLCG